MSLSKRPLSEILFLILFGAASMIFFGFFYNQHLYRLEQLQLFQLTFSYLFEHLAVQGGFAIWLGEFLTQFFRLPVAGAIIITSLLILLQRVTRSIISRVSGSSNITMLTFLPVAGYSILMIADYYCFSGLVGLMISVLTVFLYLKINNEKRRILTGMILIPAIYWLTGAGYLVFSSCIIVAEVFWRLQKPRKESGFNIWWAIFLYLFLTITFPLIIRKYFLIDTLLQSYISEAYFQFRIFFPLPLIIILFSFPVLILIQNLAGGKMRTGLVKIVNVSSLVIMSGLLLWGGAKYADFKSENEIKYDNWVYDKKWEKIIRIAEKEQPEGRTSMLAVNLALAKTGRLSSDMFNFNQNENSLFLNFEKRGMTPFIAGEPYYYMGLINFAQFFAMETIESTPDAKYPSRSFRRVAETYIINGQYDIALKYLTPLSHTLFYRRWAKERMAILNKEEDINNHTEYGELRRSRPRYDFYFDEKQIAMAMQFLMAANPENRTVYEYLMGYYLLKKDFNGFLLNISLAKNMNYSEMPIHFQEVAAYIHTITPDIPKQLIDFPVKNVVINGINSYAQMFGAGSRDAKEKIKKEFGNTYWYYLHFK